MDYYGFVRKDIAPLIKGHYKRTLEVGCGNGATLAWLKEKGICEETVGIEYSPAACAHARKKLDRVIEGDAELIELADHEQFDLILCLDVLEHLKNPSKLLSRLRKHLSPGGRLIVSLPNVRHHSVIVPLLFGGRWDYSDAGILDSTHLRFFTRSTAHRLLEESGFGISACIGSGQQWSPSRGWRWLGKLSWAEPFCAVQYLISATA